MFTTFSQPGRITHLSDQCDDASEYFLVDLMIIKLAAWR